MATEATRDSALYRVLLMGAREDGDEELARSLEEEGVEYRLEREPEARLREHGGPLVDAVLLDMSVLSRHQAGELVSRCRGARLPVIGVLSAGSREEWDYHLDLDDVVVQPLRPGELPFRLARVLARVKGTQSEQMVIVGDLIIDRERYEVSLAGQKLILTYKEYQLLVLLASNPGRVYGREALLNQVWGYDYFGGTRTVDVHVRRLRSKIEDGDHYFIETVRNVGYRFKA
jgi:two-component system alkaline phosphatase synthesis response regulator PhoP